MPHNRSPEDYEIVKYAWAMLISFWGGTVYHIQKFRDRKDKNKRWSFAEFIGDLVISGFIGLLAFYIADYAGIGGAMNAVIVGISAHMGTRMLAILENAVVDRLSSIIKGGK